MNYIKKLKALHKKLKKVIREYVLLRDKNCCSCGKDLTNANPKAKQVGHFVHKSESGAVYYEEANQNLQCYRCNIFLRGNSGAYGHYIKKKYGVKTLLKLMEAGYSKKTHQWDEEELENMIEYYSKKVKIIRKRTIKMLELKANGRKDLNLDLIEKKLK